MGIDLQKESSPAHRSVLGNAKKANSEAELEEENGQINSSESRCTESRQMDAVEPRNGLSQSYKDALMTGGEGGTNQRKYK